MGTYTERSQTQLKQTFGEDFRRWHLVEAQTGIGDVQFSNDNVDHPMHAFAVWSNGEVALRFVADRGYEHIDIGCIESAGHQNWVPFEIVGLAAGIWNEETYASAVHQWYKQLDINDPNPVPITLFGDPLSEISLNMTEIKVAAANPQKISKAEETLSRVTAKSLEEL